VHQPSADHAVTKDPRWTCCRYLTLDPELASAIVSSAAQAPEQHASDAMSRGSSWRPDDRMLAQGWDQYLAASADLYGQRMYNLLTDNCHSLVVQFLRSIQYGGSSSWDMVKLAAVVFLKAKYVSWAALLQTWLPFLVIMPLGIYFGGSPFLYGYAGLVVVLVGWFLLYTYCIWKPCPRSMPAPSQTASLTWSAS
jgi:hypothetical protein